MSSVVSICEVAEHLTTIVVELAETNFLAIWESLKRETISLLTIWELSMSDILLTIETGGTILAIELRLLHGVASSMAIGAVTIFAIL